MKDLFVFGQFENDDKLSLNRFAFIYLFIYSLNLGRDNNVATSICMYFQTIEDIKCNMFLFFHIYISNQQTKYVCTKII